MLFFNFEKDLVNHLKTWILNKNLKKVEKLLPNVTLIQWEDLDQPIVFMSGKSVIAEEMMDLDKISWQ